MNTNDAHTPKPDHHITVATQVRAALAAFACTGLALLSPSPVSAQETRIVQTRDLDLTDPRDLGRLNKRIDRAAHQVCEPDAFSDPLQLLETGHCQRVARAGAQTQLAALIERHEQRAALRAPTQQTGLADLRFPKTEPNS